MKYVSRQPPLKFESVGSKCCSNVLRVLASGLSGLELLPTILRLVAGRGEGDAAAWEGEAGSQPAGEGTGKLDAWNCR